MTPTDDTEVTFRGRPRRRNVPGWAMVVAPLGSAVATVGVLGLVAEAPTAASIALVAVGILAAAIGLWVSHR